MFVCRRCTHTLLRDALPETGPVVRLPFLYPPLRPPSSQRSSPASSFASPASGPAARTARTDGATTSQDGDRDGLNGSGLILRRDRSLHKQANLRREAVYLTDPVKLAEHTLDVLRRKDDPNKALDIVRLAGKGQMCTVSWNHIIDYYLGKQMVDPAYKTYNEVRYSGSCQKQPCLSVV